LGPAVAELAVVAVHAGADGVGGVAETNLSAGGFYSASEGDVFEDAAGDRGMASNGVIDFALYQDVLAVGGCGGGIWIAHFRGRVLASQFREDYRQRGHLPESDGDLFGRVGEQVGVIL